MKRLLFIIALLSFSNFANAEDDTKSIALKIGIPGSIMLETAVTDRLSLGVEVAGTRFYPETSSSSQITSGYINTRALGARAVWQPKGVFKRGPYLAGWADYLSFDYDSYGTMVNTTDSSTITGSGSTVAAGIMMGYQYFWENSELMLSFGAGYGLIKGTSFDAQKTTTTYTATSSSSQVSNVSASTKTSDVFTFDVYIGFLF